MIKNLIPKYIEFSAKDNQIWLVTNQNSVLLDKISDVKYSEKSKDLKFSTVMGEISRVPIYVTVIKDTLEFKNSLLSEQEKFFHRTVDKAHSVMYNINIIVAQPQPSHVI